MKQINAKGVQVSIFQKEKMDYISLTDIARCKNSEAPADVVKNWMRTRSTIEFLGIWEKLNNDNFKGVEFDQFKIETGVNSFVLSPQKWIQKTNAVGMISKSGRYGGGTFAHKDIAFEFASWISPEFKLYLIKEFQRLKYEESKKLDLDWDTKRILAKINYRIHTDAIKNYLIPKQLSKIQINNIYASEADVLNLALFGMTAKEWQKKNPAVDGNVRDNADIIQLVCLANLEILNSEFIRQQMPQKERLIRLNEIAIIQMKSLTNSSFKSKITKKL